MSQDAALLKLNPALEALSWGDKLAVFAGDRCLAFEGRNNVTIFERLKTVFSRPRHREELSLLEPDIYSFINELISTEVLVIDVRSSQVEFFGKGRIASILCAKITEDGGKAKQASSLLVCIPDSKGLDTQKHALSALKEGQSLLTGICRGTSVFILPLVSSRREDLFRLFFRLLSTERGRGNSYLIDELHSLEDGDAYERQIEPVTAEWVASDLHALMKRGMLNSQVARCYRGTSLVREDISFSNTYCEAKGHYSDDENCHFLVKTFVGAGKVIARHCEYDLGLGTEVFASKAEMARPEPFQLQENEDLETWGTGTSRTAARLAAIMEALERYSIRSYSMEQFPLIPRRLLDKPILERIKVCGYGRQDLYGPDLDPNAPRRWHNVKSLLSNEQYLVPLEQIRYPVPVDRAGHEVVDQVTSSGVAAHFSESLAIKAACHELVEREAFLIAWLRKASPPLIDLASLPDSIRREVVICENLGWTVRFMDLTADLAPVICVLLSRVSDLDRHAIGASSRDSVEAACLKAFREAMINFCLFRKRPRDAETVLGQMGGPMDHIELYATGAHDDVLLRFFGSQTRRAFRDIRTFDDDIVRRIHGAGLEVFIADVCHDEIKRLAPSIHVVRALVPGLTPMVFGKNWPRTGSSRILHIPEQAGWPTQAAPDEGEYERFPHPFN